MKGIKLFDAILFDNDGTIVDTHDLILVSMRHATREVLGTVVPDEELMAHVGVPLADQMLDFSDDPEVVERLLDSYRAINHELHDEQVKAFPGLIDVLARLHGEGIPLGVVTSKMHALAWKGLTIVGAAPYLDCLIGPDDFPEHKPKPGPVLEGLRRLEAAGKISGIHHEDCVYVGDSIFDINAGNAAGCTTIAVTWGMGKREDLVAASPDFIVDTPEELLSVCLS